MKRWMKARVNGYKDERIKGCKDERIKV